MRKVGLIVHTEKSEAKKIANGIISLLEKKKVGVKIPIEDANNIGRGDLGCSEKDLTKEAEAIIVLGGDGSILRAARIINGHKIPVLGINLGRFGFLAEVEIKDVNSALERIVAKDFSFEGRMMLDCDVVKEGKVLVSYKALNEVVIGRGISHRLMGLDVYINNSFFINYAADGLIFSTPTGSTAYSLSAGGPIASPLARVILLTPVCPHTIFNRTLVFSDKDEIRIEPVFQKEEVSIHIDGQIAVDVASFDSLRVSVSKSSLNLIKLEPHNFFALVKRKLKFGDCDF
ncbi:MAG: NAD(+)/NADH kinase [Actinobacteria bacterium]|nr:NAD(+)/NADH kinase [Actinomycetota bacterium]